MIAAVATAAALVAAAAATLFAAIAATYAHHARNAWREMRQPKGRALTRPGVTLDECRHIIAHPGDLTPEQAADFRKRAR